MNDQTVTFLRKEPSISSRVKTVFKKSRNKQIPSNTHHGCRVHSTFRIIVLREILMEHGVKNK